MMFFDGGVIKFCELNGVKVYEVSVVCVVLEWVKFEKLMCKLRKNVEY